MAEMCACCSTPVDWWVRLRSHPDLPIRYNCLAGLNAQQDGQRQLITGTWMVTGFEPIFKVADVTRSVAWFTRAGFETWFHDDTYALRTGIGTSQSTSPGSQATNFRVAALSTFTAKTPVG